MKPTKRVIVDFFLRHESGSSGDVHVWMQSNTDESPSLVTVKRALATLTKSGVLVREGRAASTRYVLTLQGRLSASVDAHEYNAEEPDKRYGFTGYNHDLFAKLTFDLFTPPELEKLKTATHAYRKKTKRISETIRQKELERFVIEFSWKSSKIEGNTYTLLDTEHLLKEGKESPGHTKDEAAMIVNHKTAFDFIYKQSCEFRALTRAHLERIHALLVENLPIQRNLRAGLVGVTGSRYRPLDNQHQIREAVEAMLGAIHRMPHGYAKALLALLGVSYIQPFEDGNKRTARLVANALLLAYDLAPLSYRSVDEVAYREAMLAFYELNSVEPFKKIFMEQYLFATEQYGFTKV